MQLKVMISHFFAGLLKYFAFALTIGLVSAVVIAFVMETTRIMKVMEGMMWCKNVTGELLTPFGHPFALNFIFICFFF